MGDFAELATLASSSSSSASQMTRPAAKDTASKSNNAVVQGYRAEPVPLAAIECDRNASVAVSANVVETPKSIARPTCVVCLENTAELVSKQCGHLAWCRSCHREVV